VRLDELPPQIATFFQWGQTPLILFSMGSDSIDSLFNGV
jgi:hypothetical protein